MSATGGGETRANISGWTVDTLHAHIQTMLNERDRYWLALMDEREKRHEQRFLSSAEATRVYEEIAKQWRASANEWRGAMDNKDATYATKEMLDAKFKSIRENLVAAVVIMSGVIAIAIAVLTYAN